MSCEIKLQLNGLYTMVLKEQYLFFFERTTKMIFDLTKDQVRNMEIPFVKIVRNINVPYDVFPKRTKI